MKRAADLGVLALLGAGTLASTYWLGRELDPGDFGRPLHVLAGVTAAFLLLWAAAVAWVVWRRPRGRDVLVLVLLVAAAARLMLVFGEVPLNQAPLSNDVFRYVWDGRVQSHGINPYAHAPSDSELAGLRDSEIYAHLNRKDGRTIYPPVAQSLYRLLYELHPDSVRWTRLAFAVLDLVAIALLAWLLLRLGRPPSWALVYAWHPLVTFEIASSGHVEGVAVLLVLLALHASYSRRAALTGVLAGAAGLVKFYAVGVLPALVRPDRWLRAGLAVAATVVVAYLPFVGAGDKVLGFLPTYLDQEGITKGTRFYPLDLLGLSGSVAAALYVGVVGLALIAVALRFARDAPSMAGALVLMTAALVLFTPAYPWYCLLVIALLPMARGAVLLPAGAIALLWPFLYLHISAKGFPEWPRHLVYGTCLAALAAAALWSQRRGAVASSLIPSLKVTSARKPSASAASSGEAKT
jgi:alpha-1,6-mannosyltransferase